MPSKLERWRADFKAWGLLEIAGKRVDLCPYCVATARIALAKRWAFAWPDCTRPPNPLERTP